ncbi:hypothetical protein ABPG72_022107 [Tetrahymena utriculariae]
MTNKIIDENKYVFYNSYALLALRAEEAFLTQIIILVSYKKQDYDKSQSPLIIYVFYMVPSQQKILYLHLGLKNDFLMIEFLSLKKEILRNESKKDDLQLSKIHYCWSKKESNLNNTPKQFEISIIQLQNTEIFQ